MVRIPREDRVKSKTEYHPEEVDSLAYVPVAA